MAIQAVSLIAVWFLVTTVAQRPCGMGKCTLVPVRRDLAVKFQELASEKGVRLVYFNLEIGNDSLHPLESNERFLAKRWIWARTIREPMLLMTDDMHDIHSLGLLRRQKRYMNVQLEEQPTGCLARSNASCQDNVVGETLLGNITNLSHGNRLPPTDCVCTFHKNNFSREGWETLCCSVQEITERNDTVYRCGIAPENDWFVTPFYSISFFFQFILVLYGPAIPLLLPDWFFKLQHEWSKEKEEQKAEIEKTVDTEDDTDNQVLTNQEDGTELIDIEETVESENDSQKELDRRYKRNLSAVRENKDERQIDNLELPNQQGIVLMVDTEWEDDTDEDEDSDSSDELDRRCEEISALHDAKRELEFEIPLDDTSPITFCALVSNYLKELPLIQMNFNLKLLLLFFVVFPFVLHIKFAVISFYNLEFYHEVKRKFDYSVKETISQIKLSAAFGPQSIAGDSWQNIAGERKLIGFNATVCVALFLILSFIRPKDLLCRKGRGEFICGIYCHSDSLGEEIVQNLRTQHQEVCDLTLSTLELYTNTLKKCLMKLTLRHKIRKSRGTRALRSWWVILFLFPGFLIGAALGIACILIFLLQFVIFLTVFSPLVTFLLFFCRKEREIFIHLARPCYRYIGYNADLFIIAGVSAMVTCFPFIYYLWYVTTISVAFICTTFLFTIMGVVLNIEFLTVYVVFILVVVRNIYLCYLNLQNRYKEVKDMISKHWEKETADLLWIKSSGNNGTIPKELFWFVCDNDESDFEDRILPLRTEICFMLRDMALIVLFLCLFFLAIVIFETMEDISALVSTFFVFISGVIPTLIFKRFTKKKQFSGWSKINIDKKIKEAVHEYTLGRMEEIPNSYEVPGPPVAWL